jgi:hypothetical protein
VPTPNQIRLIHVAASQVALSDAQYRMLLHNVADVETSKQLGNDTFEQVMAVLEGMGFDGRLRCPRVTPAIEGELETLARMRHRCLPELVDEATRGRQATVQGLRPCEAVRVRMLLNGSPIFFPVYWADKAARQGKLANARMVHKIRELGAQQRYELPAMVLRMSGRRTDQVEQLTPHEAWNLIEALKAVIDREGGRPAPPPTDIAKERVYAPDFAPVTDDEVPF